MSEFGGRIVRLGAGGAGALLALGLLVAPAGATGNGQHGNGERSGTAACFDQSGRTQGRSTSDPDGMSNGGPDKPGCPGGFDADQDGNNGCGNDADREDDNNGHCGRKPASDRDDDGSAPEGSTTTTTSTSTTTTTAPGGTVTSDGTVAPDAAEPTDCQIDPKEAEGCDAATAAAARTSPAGILATAGDQTRTGIPADVSATTAGDPAVQGAATTSEPQTEVLGQTLERPGALARTGAGVGGLTLLGGLLCGSGRLAVLARRFLRID